MDKAKLYWHYVSISLRSQMQYRTSFFLQALAQFLITGIEFIAIYSLFERFGSLSDWSLYEVCLVYGMANISFALAEAFARGFDMFASMVKSGDFDRLLLRPLSTVFQITASQIQLMRIGRLSQGVMVLVWGINQMPNALETWQVFLILFGILGGISVFSGLFILQATLCFWTTESLEIANTLTYGGVQTASYPLSIYKSFFKDLFTFVVPLACMNYFPVLAILGKSDPLGTSFLFQSFSPFIGFIFLFICLKIWAIGERRYQSTGS